MSEEHEEWIQDPEAQQRRETFARFGLAMFQAQCVERQIGILLATTVNREFLRTPSEERARLFEMEFARTLGNLVKALRERMTVASEFESRLRRAVEIRNWLAHDYFWERAGSILTWDGRQGMISELQAAADYLGAVDEELTAISMHWLDRIGVSREAVELEMIKYKRGLDT